MKRTGYLFEKIVAFDNLLGAAQRAVRGKKKQVWVAYFLFHLEKDLLLLQNQLVQGIWQPGPFRVFEIREPKVRRISAATLHDRVVHHAICNVLEPIFDQRLIFDTWACRRGKGNHKAVKRAQAFCRRYPYFLKCDIRRYFDSIDHGILKKIIRRIFKDERLLILLEQIIDHPLPGSMPGKGLPIGNLTSQYFANLYLGELDHELKDLQGIKAYLRYMDDMVIFARDKTELHAILGLLEKYIWEHLQLHLKPSATRLAPVTEGIPFLGFQIFPGMIRLNRQSLQRFCRRLRKNENAYINGKTDMDSLTLSTRSMIAHMRHANTQRLRQSLLSSSCVSG